MWGRWHLAAGWQLLATRPPKASEGRLPIGRKMPSCPTFVLWPCVHVRSDISRFALESRRPLLYVAHSHTSPEVAPKRPRVKLRNCPHAGATPLSELRCGDS